MIIENLKIDWQRNNYVYPETLLQKVRDVLDSNR